MDFFEAQARAKQRTARLVWMFAFAVLGTIAAGYIAAMLVMRNVPREVRPMHGGIGLSDDMLRTTWWDPQVFLWVALGTILVIGIASLFKWSQMRHGGRAVAEMVGGREIDPRTKNLAERRLLNVVEEMAIASGVPVPSVFVIDGEPCLNAFAAGLTTNDAAVAVTKGTMEKMTRDELQGVIAHEFSHILNGDMRLNVRITAIVFGILVIGLIGRGIIYSMGRGRIRSSGGKNKGGGVAVLFAIGLALMIIGYVGYFFGRLIQSAVSRQREYLADAAAVQFTRNPGGIAGALKKIGGYALGGRLQTSKAAEIGHFFFAQCFKSSFGGLWATHPPLPERIRAVEPSWDGKYFEPPVAVDVGRESFAQAGFGGQRFAPAEALERVHAAGADVPPLPRTAPIAFRPVAVIAEVGMLAEAQIKQARSLVSSIPETIRDAAHDTEQVTAVVYGLLLQGAEKTSRETQLGIVGKHAGEAAVTALKRLLPPLSVLDPAVRLPALQLCEPALRRLDAPSLDLFLATLDELVHADAQVTPYEFAMQKMLVHHLRLAKDPARASPHTGAGQRADDIGLILSVLAHLGSRDEQRARAAFSAGFAQLKSHLPPALIARDRCSLEKLDTALDRIAALPLPDKKEIIAAAAHTVGVDGVVTIEEADLFRAISAAIGIPMPPLAPSGA